MNGFKDTELGAFPVDWEVLPLESVCAKMKAGGTPKTAVPSYWNGDIPLVKVEDVVNARKCLRSTNLHITKAGLENSSAYLLPPKSVLLTMYGTAGEVTINEMAVAPTQNVLGICPNEKTSSDFLYYALRFGKAKALELIVDRTIFKHFTLAKAKRLLIVLPPKKGEQDAISSCLSLIQSAIENQEKIIRTTTELKRALMQKLFTEGLQGEKQKQTEIGMVPQNWKMVPLSRTGEVVYGIQAAVANLTKPIGTKILTNINISFDGKIDLAHLRYYLLTKPRHFKTVLRKGDILFNWRSGSKEHVGKTAFFDLEGEYTHSSFILRIRTDKGVLNKYLFYYLTYLRASGYFRKLQSYSVNAKFNASAVNALPTALPEYDEQKDIADILSTIDLKLDNQTKKMAVLQSLFESLLYQLMTGQIRVKDLDLKIKETVTAT